jgi:hypothetical protein
MEEETGMAYALVQDVAWSWQQYERLAAGLYEPLPDGLIVHLAGPTDEGVRMIGVWESEQDWRRFQSERLQPALVTLGGPRRPEPTVRHLRGAELVLGGPAPALKSKPQGGEQ